ncbi:MAG: excisionase family DNA-binding protein [Vicinamibacteria bacterium]
MSRPKSDGSIHRVSGALLDVAAAAEYLGVTASTMRHWLDRRHVPALRIGGRVLLRRETLDRHLAAKEREWMRARGESA